MVESRADNIDNFVIDLVEKVTLNAMDIVDGTNEYPVCRRCSGRKIRTQTMRLARSGNYEAKKKYPCENENLAQELDLNAERNVSVDANQRASEEIRKIVEGLQGVQIGDSPPVQPAREMSNLERQVKRAVADMSGTCEIYAMNGPIVEGHGDLQELTFNENVVDSVAEVEYEINDLLSSKIADLDCDVEKQNGVWQQQQRKIQPRLQPEVGKLRSTCFLHRMIEELEDAETNRENILSSTATISAHSQERIAAWEESEEKFVRTIEGGKNDVEEEIVEVIESSPIIEEQSEISSLENVRTECIVGVRIEELNSEPSSPVPDTPLTPPLSPSTLKTDQCLEAKKSSTIPRDGDEFLERSKTKNKKSVGEKLRRFFRSAFKRGKDC